MKKKTIYALATPRGKSALSVFRLSGEDCFKIIEKITRKSIKKYRTPILLELFDNNKKPVDKSLVTLFKKPKSYTGENMVEMSLHGSPAVIKKIINIFSKQKEIRLADPGEFTKRSFENGKLDLTKVEAIADLINSETEAQRKAAYENLSGKLTNKINNYESKITKTLANIEAFIDFSDEDLPSNLIKEIKEQIENIIKDIEETLKENIYGEKLRSGFVVTILGKPNTGKSSFINRLAEREIAIVTDKPGTTRDVIELFIELKDIPVKFYDTAGIRRPKNIIEGYGIKKTKDISGVSDINLVFLNNIKEIKEYKNTKNKIFIRSKADIRRKNKQNLRNTYNISSKTGKGIKDLLEKIYTKLAPNNIAENSYVSRERQKNCLKNTVLQLKKTREKKNIDLFAEDIRIALNEICKISGKKDVEDILGIIFNDFCIGK